MPFEAGAGGTKREEVLVVALDDSRDDHDDIHEDIVGGRRAECLTTSPYAFFCRR